MKADRFGSRPRRVADLIRVSVPAGLAEAAAQILSGDAGRAVERDVLRCAPGRECLLCRLDLREADDAGIDGIVTRLEELERVHPDAQLELEREEHLVEEDSAAARPEGFRPFCAAPGLVIRPPWEPCEAGAGELVVEIDPGPAFGSGAHASTRLALALLRELCLAAPPRRMLDVGTGTGVLALAGALWGAREVTAVDCDPGAVATARENVARNGLAGRIRVGSEGLDQLAAGFDLIAANLTAEVILGLAGRLADLLGPGGALVLSGVLAGGQDGDVRRACEQLGLECEQEPGEGEWVALLLRRPAP